MATEIARYNDDDLAEFKAIIEEKLKTARMDYEYLMDTINNKGSNDVIDTMPTYKILEEGSVTQTHDELCAHAQRQYKFIQGLEAALRRIENKNYGVCRVTGKLIPKERLRIVPHATLSVEAKQMKDRKD